MKNTLTIALSALLSAAGMFQPALAHEGNKAHRDLVLYYRQMSLNDCAEGRMYNKTTFESVKDIWGYDLEDAHLPVATPEIQPVEGLLVTDITHAMAQHYCPDVF